jgi:glycine/D-amino acid oxidase-like deaminating enzyme
MALRSLALWQEFFERTGRSFFHKTGALWLAKNDNRHANESRAVLRDAGVAFEDLSPADLRKRYPQICPEPGTGAVFEVNAGALMARQAVHAVVEDFVRTGGKYHQAAVAPVEESAQAVKVSTTDGDAVNADAYVFACGPWLGKVFPQTLGNRIFPTRQEVLFFGVPPGDLHFKSPHLPIWFDFEDALGAYGFPDLEARGFKIAFDLHGDAFDPDSTDRIVSRNTIAYARDYLARRFPALLKSPIVDSRVCQYENTSNGDFLIDRHPCFSNVWIVGGGSGHGFKHGPAVGDYITGQITRIDQLSESRFSYATKATSQQRSVV